METPTYSPPKPRAAAIDVENEAPERVLIVKKNSRFTNALLVTAILFLGIIVWEVGKWSAENSGAQTVTNSIERVHAEVLNSEKNVITQISNQVSISGNMMQSAISNTAQSVSQNTNGNLKLVSDTLSNLASLVETDGTQTRKKLDTVQSSITDAIHDSSNGVVSALKSQFDDTNRQISEARTRIESLSAPSPLPQNPGTSGGRSVAASGQDTSSAASSYVVVGNHPTPANGGRIAWYHVDPGSLSPEFAKSDVESGRVILGPGAPPLKALVSFSIFGKWVPLDVPAPAGFSLDKKSKKVMFYCDDIASNKQGFDIGLIKE